MSNQNSMHNGSGDDDRHSRLHQRVERHLLRTIISGFIVLFPLFVTIIVVIALFGYAHSAFGRLVAIAGNYVVVTLNAEGSWVETAVNTMSPLISMFIMLVTLYVFGMLVTFGAGRKAVQIKQKVLANLPITKSIYKVAQQVVESVIAQRDGHHFSRVVFVEWPRENYLALGFITAHCYSNKLNKEPLLVVYIPTVPNPTSGNLAYVAESDVIETDLSIEEAMKIVFSGGMVHPDRMRVEVPPDTGKILSS